MGWRVCDSQWEALRDSRAAASSAMERTAVSAAECSRCMRTAGAISGRERRPGCGDGSPVLPNSIRCQTVATHALIEGDNGALLISMHGGIRQLVDGKAEAYPLPDGGRQFNPDSAAPGSRWRSVDRNSGPGTLACAPGKDGCVCAV